MKKYIFTSVIMTIALLVAFTSCSNDSTGLYTPRSSGLPYELLVVASDEIWESDGGQALESVLKSDIPGLPQSEASFHVMRVIPMHYDKVMKMMRNIVVVNVGDNYRQTKLKYAENMFSVPQLILTIQAPDTESLKDFVLSKQDFIIKFFNDAELKRQADELRKNHSDTISKYTTAMFSYDICAPYELRNFKIADNFIWSSSENPIGPLNFMSYSYPYTSEKCFTREGFIAKRDSVTKINMPGAFENSYMTLDTLALSTTDRTENGNYLFEARGLWKMKGDMMGGPFISQSRVDTLTNRVIVTEVFVYAPEKMKRRYIKKLESSLQTFKFVKATDKTEEK